MVSPGYKKLERYGIIGNLDTCALVGDDGSIDWCCFPHIESPSVFGALLDIAKGGRFQIAPKGPYTSSQLYVGATNVLETTFRTDAGEATLTDFMPLKGWDKTDELSHQAIYRKVICGHGTMEIEVTFQPRFDYSRGETTLGRRDGGVLVSSPGERMFLISQSPLSIHGPSATGSHALTSGESLWLVLQYGHDRPVDSASFEELLAETVQFWLDWGHKCERSACVFDGPWHEHVVRSGLTLKLLTHQETGAIAAAPTTSLPEEIGGTRNWDYRYNWIRDASFTVQALYNAGHVAEAKKHLSWFLDICTRSKGPAETKIMYGMHGDEVDDEYVLGHLSGYRDSAPVRVGNAATGQVQLDIYGELLSAVYDTTRYGEAISDQVWSFLVKVVEYVREVWRTKDAGIWEVRGAPRHFVHSKIMCWVALDRAVKIAEQGGRDAPLEAWRASMAEIQAAIIEHGYNSGLNSFTQSFDSPELDATALLIPILGFLPIDDPMVQGTIDAVMATLMSREGLVSRYIGYDGLAGKEGAFILCTFWLVDVLALSGRVAEAERVFLGVLRYISPLGLYSEEIDIRTGELRGNYPQAFSHIGLMNSAIYLGRARGRRQMGPEPLGEGIL